MESLGALRGPLILGGGLILLILGIPVAMYFFMMMFLSGPPPQPIQEEGTGGSQISSEVKYAKYINQAAAKYPKISPALIAAVIKQESGFRKDAVSSVGASGLMQLMPGTAKELGVKDRFNPKQNIMGGTKYLNQLHKKYKGDLKLVLAAYNSGPGRVDQSLKEGGSGVPEIAETQNYVKKVTGYYKDYQKMLEGGKLVVEFDGKFGWPVDSSISPGCDIHCYDGHTGQDFPAPIGSPIYAAGNGKVKKVETPANNSRLGPQRSYGTYILIDHGKGYSTLYAHMYPGDGDIKVKVGDQVKRGEQIARVGNYGNSSGSHLHFEVRKKNKPQDPMKYLK